MTSVNLRSADGVAYLTLSRPEIRNALSGDDMIEDLLDATHEAEEDRDTAVLVFRVDGPAFSAGGNLKDMEAKRGLFDGGPAQLAENYRDSIQQLTRFMATTDLVTIAAVDGPAIGAGFDLVIGCDLRIGTRNARFAHTFLEMGLIPGDGGAWLLPRVVGWQRAAELAFTSRSISAAEAERFGVLLEVVPSEKLDERVAELAGAIAAKPRPALMLAKRLLRQAQNMDLDSFLDMTAAFQGLAHSTPEHETAVAAYLSKLRSQD